MRCSDLTERLAESEGQPDSLRGRARRHASECLRCQAELAQYRKLSRAMRALRDERFEPPAGLLSALIAAVEGTAAAPAPHRLGRRVAYIGGLAAAGAAGAILVAARSRRTRLRLAS